MPRAFFRLARRFCAATAALSLLGPMLPAHAQADPFVMRICTAGGDILYVPLPGQEPDEDRRDSPAPCHAPCVCDRRKPAVPSGA